MSEITSNVLTVSAAQLHALAELADEFNSPPSARFMIEQTFTEVGGTHLYVRRGSHRFGGLTCVSHVSASGKVQALVA